MSLRTPLSALGVFVIFATPLLAQAPAGGDAVPCGVPIAALPPCGGAEKPATGTVAIVDGSVFTWKDLDEQLKQKVEHLDDAVARARRAALSAEIEEALLDAEAARRKLLPRDFYFAEVVRKIAAPSDAEVSAEYDAHRDRYGKRPLQDSRAWIGSVLFAEREKARASELAGSIRSRVPVEMKANPDAPGLTQTSVLATVGPRPITVASASTRLEASAWAVRWEVWREESAAVEKLVHEHVLKAEAVRRGVTPEALVASEVSGRLKPPSEEEIVRYFKKYQAFFGDDLAAVRAKVIQGAQGDAKAAREAEFDRELRAGRQVRILVDEPASPVLAVESPSAPSRGSPRAAVMVVEFGDFQCPPCGFMYGIVEEALRPFGDRVRYQFRHYPMGFHEFALKASEAAMAAGEQGHFWEYAEVLFRNQKALEVGFLKRYAVEVGLDSERFAKDLDSGRFTAAALEEKRAGARAGVQGTPAFFVNGVRLPYSAYSVTGIRGAVESARTRLPSSALFLDSLDTGGGK
ncbi:MAG: DsbA family protein [Thermoanaerobaculia bacterium]